MKKTCWTERKDSKEFLNNPGQAAGHRAGLLQHSRSRIWEVRVNQEATAGVSSTGAWRGSVQACHAARDQHPGDSSWAGWKQRDQPCCSPGTLRMQQQRDAGAAKTSALHKPCASTKELHTELRPFHLFCQNPGFPPHPSPPAL